MSDTLKLRTPCCDRAVTPCDRRVFSTLVVERTCPKCRTAYRLVVTPITPERLEGRRVYYHQVNWNPKS